jgi:hypothetical protein
MIGKLLLGIGVLAGATLAAASFTYSQMAVFTRSTVEYMNNFEFMAQDCLVPYDVVNLQTITNNVCSSADVISFIDIENEGSRVSNLFSYGSSMLSTMSSSITASCETPGISLTLQQKALEMSNWASQINSGAPVSLSQISVVNSLKTMASNLNAGLMSSAGYDLGETILYDM